MGLVLAILGTYTVRIHYHADGSSIQPCDKDGTDVIFIGVRAFACALYVSTCIACSVSVRVSGEAAQARGWQRAKFYPIIMLSTLLPELLIDSTSVHPSIMLEVLSHTGLACIGLFNALVYIHQKRIAERTSTAYTSIGDLLSSSRS